MAGRSDYRRHVLLAGLLMMAMLWLAERAGAPHRPAPAEAAVSVAISAR